MFCLNVLFECFQLPLPAVWKSLAMNVNTLVGNANALAE